MVGCDFFKNQKENERDWISTLLLSNFFVPCRRHQDLRKNEKNMFCIDCNLDLCKHCKTGHYSSHKKLQICKYVYQDVVRLQDMQMHYDCSEIQTYKINGEKAVHLNPRPQSKDAKPSTKAKFGASCVACGRYIQDLPNRFCSIACKVTKLKFSSFGKTHESPVSLQPKDQTAKMITYSNEELSGFPLKENCSLERHSSENESTLSLTDMSEETQGWTTNSSLKPRRLRLHKRKGIPRRATLF